MAPIRFSLIACALKYKFSEENTPSLIMLKIILEWILFLLLFAWILICTHPWMSHNSWKGVMLRLVKVRSYDSLA